MNDNSVAESIMASSIQKMILNPHITYGQAEKLAIQIIHDLYKLDRFIVHLPNDKELHCFKNPKD